MNNEDISSADEDTLRSKGFVKCERRQRYLLKERVGLVPENGKMVEGVTARIIMIWTEKAARKAENTEMKINYGNDNYKWVHPDEYADTRYAYYSAQKSYEAPEPVIETIEEESTDPTQDAMEEFISKEIRITRDESAEEIFKGLDVAEMRELCKTRFNYRLPMTVKKTESAMRNIKKNLED